MYWQGGSLGPLYQPLELLIIGGGWRRCLYRRQQRQSHQGVVQKFLPRLKRTKKYNKALYMELMALQYKILSKVRREGMLGIERDIDNPQESPLFQEHPSVLADPHIMNFLTDYLRLMVSGGMEPMEIDELMLHEIEVFEQEAHVPIDAIAKVGDAMPAFGIVAAVMGVIKALTYADASPEQMGEMIAHALVGTFLGILMGYGFISPIASYADRQAKEAEKNAAVHSRNAAGEPARLRPAARRRIWS